VALAVAAATLAASGAGYVFLRRMHPPSEADRVFDNPAWRKQVEEYARLNARYAGQPVIVFAGDSITRRFPLDDFFPRGAGALPLVNRGINSDTVAGLERRWDRTIGNLRVDTLFLMIGTNDLLYRTADETAIRVEALLRRAPGARVVVQSMLPAPATRRGVHENAVRYNALLREMCARHGYTFLDLYPAFADARGEMKPGLQRDGVHPVAAGYRLWSEALRPYLERDPPPEPGRN
jgi:lysophospholipase L1-like esterase